jgi:DNA polymerase-3 subunit gamma/tau
MNEAKLNLARKWRSKQFGEIVGQDLSLRMLKNSLYLQQYFPVYLFSGQRGCGKTTTARVFAAALNCEQLPLFQKNPQAYSMPCLQCNSCKAMEGGKHPDFIEIDAASHTGVDHVRTLIDSAALLPLMGRKKIYLIDEAHMLSKAAFNALLKILEEPPMSVLFILATTDSQKIIDTVQSRCFQLFFHPVPLDVLQIRLQQVCMTENIIFEPDGLTLIIQRTHGSVRDALNLLEQVRFASKEVNKAAVQEVLGFIDDAVLIALFERVITASRKELLQLIASLSWHRYAAHIIWERFMELLRAALWIKYDVVPSSFSEYHAAVRTVVRTCSAQQLTAFLQYMYEQELVFAKTTAKHEFIEMVLLHMCGRMNRSDSDSGASSPSNPLPLASQSEIEEGQALEESEDDEQEPVEQEGIAQQWQQFLVQVASLNDPLMYSIFVQGKVQEWQGAKRVVHVEFSKELAFFSDLLEQTRRDWQPLLHHHFGEGATIEPRFTGAVRTSVPKIVVPKKEERAPVARSVRPETPKKQEPWRAQPSRPSFVKRNSSAAAPKLFATDVAIDISDATHWQKNPFVIALSSRKCNRNS